MDIRPSLPMIIFMLILLVACAYKNPDVKVTPVYYTGQHEAYEQAAKMISPAIDKKASENSE